MQYRIKPLVWIDDWASCWANTVFGTLLYDKGPSHGYPGCLRLPGHTFVKYDTLDAAKLAAESWYRERLLEALEPVEE